MTVTEIPPSTARKYAAYRHWAWRRDVAWVPGWGWTPGMIIVETGRQYWRGPRG